MAAILATNTPIPCAKLIAVTHKTIPHFTATIAVAIVEHDSWRNFTVVKFRIPITQCNNMGGSESCMDNSHKWYWRNDSEIEAKCIPSIS